MDGCQVTHLLVGDIGDVNAGVVDGGRRTSTGSLDKMVPTWMPLAPMTRSVSVNGDPACPTSMRLRNSSISMFGSRKVPRGGKWDTYRVIRIRAECRVIGIGAGYEP